MFFIVAASDRMWLRDCKSRRAGQIKSPASSLKDAGRTVPGHSGYYGVGYSCSVWACFQVSRSARLQGNIFLKKKYPRAHSEPGDIF